MTTKMRSVVTSDALAGCCRRSGAESSSVVATATATATVTRESGQRRLITTSSVVAWWRPVGDARTRVFVPGQVLHNLRIVRVK